MRNIWIVLLFAVAAIGVCVAGIYVWQAMGPVALGFHGWLAIALGVCGSFALGGGLMFLSFYSARSGHDDDANTEHDSQG